MGRPRLNKSEMPTGKFRPERPKPTSALLKQNNESLKMAIQSILPPNDTPPVNLMSTDDDLAFPTDPTIINASDLEGAQTFEVITSTGIVEDATDIQAAQTSTTPVKFVTSSSPFVQLKPPTTTGRVQSPGVKNFFIRKGIDKKAPTQSFYTVRAQPAVGDASSLQSSTPNDKKIIIKSQQIIKPGNVQTSSSSIDTITTTSATDLSDILDLPILFADNDGNLQDQSAITSSPTAGASVHVDSSDVTSTPTTTTNILITSPDGKLPNRPVVISAANVLKQTKPSSPSPVTLKLIFSGDRLNTLGRDDRLETLNKTDLKSMPPLKLTSAQYRELQDRHNLKSLPPLKLATTGQSATASLAGPGTFTKLAPGTKIDLSTLKIVKSGTSPSTSGNIAFKTATVQHRDASKGTIVFKPSTGLQSHQVLKSGILNRNITVRKVVNLMPTTGSSVVTQHQLQTIQSSSSANRPDASETKGGADDKTRPNGLPDTSVASPPTSTPTATPNIDAEPTK